MEIVKISNSLKSGVVRVNKGISSLVIVTSVSPLELTNETINVEVERANGDNTEITKGNMPLKDFIALTTSGDDAITYSRTEQGFVSICELTLDGGAIHMYEKETILFSMSNCLSTRTYNVYGLEEPFSTQEVQSFERKSMAADDDRKTFLVADYNAVSIDAHDSITELTFGYNNGNSVKYSPKELVFMSASADPLKCVNASGSIESVFSGKHVLPLKSVSGLDIETIEIRKEQGTIINLTFRH